jgi:hypothetical protein
MRASTSALDAEDQDQEETPIPGAHNCPPARLFYRTFPSYVYTFFFPEVRDLARTVLQGVFPLPNRAITLVARAVGSKGPEDSSTRRRKLYQSGSCGVTLDSINPGTHYRTRESPGRSMRKVCKQTSAVGASWPVQVQSGSKLSTGQVPQVLRVRSSRFIRGWISSSYMLLRDRKRRPAQKIPHNPVRSRVEGSGTEAGPDSGVKLKSS